MFPAALPNTLNEFIFIVIITILVVRVVVSKGIHKMAVALLLTSCNLLQAPAESREVREDAIPPPPPPCVCANLEWTQSPRFGCAEMWQKTNRNV